MNTLHFYRPHFLNTNGGFQLEILRGYLAKDSNVMSEVFGPRAPSLSQSQKQMGHHAVLGVFTCHPSAIAQRLQRPRAIHVQRGQFLISGRTVGHAGKAPSNSPSIGDLSF